MHLHKYTKDNFKNIVLYTNCINDPICTLKASLHSANSECCCIELVQMKTTSKVLVLSDKKNSKLLL